MKKNLGIVVAVSDNLAFAAGNIAIALNRYMKIEYDLLVYTIGMSEKNRAVLNLIPNCKVIDYEFPEGFVDNMMNSLPEGCRFKDERKLMRFCHYEAFKILSDYKNSFWIDADMSIQGDISGMLEYGPFGITTDEPWDVRSQFISPIAGYDLDRMGVCSGIMRLSDSLPYEEIYRWLYEKTIEYAHFMKNGDQAIINLMIQKFDIEPILMPRDIYQCKFTKREAIDAKVVHFGWETKIWDDKYIMSFFPEWYRVHKEWLELGGEDFKLEDKNPQNYLKDFELFMLGDTDLGALIKRINQLDNQKEKVIVYGCGGNYSRYYIRLAAKYDIVAVFDREVRRKIEYFGEREIFEPETINRYNYEKVIVTPFNNADIIEYLVGYGISRDIIIPIQALLDEDNQLVI